MTNGAITPADGLHAVMDAITGSPKPDVTITLFCPPGVLHMAVPVAVAHASEFHCEDDMMGTATWRLKFKVSNLEGIAAVLARLSKQHGIDVMIEAKEQ